MKTTHILLLCILGAALVSTVVCQSGTGPKECCFDFYSRRVKEDLVKSYYKTESQCAKTAVILVTSRSRICVDPAVRWVQTIMKTLEEKSL